MRSQIYSKRFGPKNEQQIRTKLSFSLFFQKKLDPKYHYFFHSDDGLRCRLPPSFIKVVCHHTMCVYIKFLHSLVIK